MGKTKRFLSVTSATAALFIFAVVFTIISISSAESQPSMKQEEALVKAIEISEAKVSKSVITFIVRHKDAKFDKNTIKIQLNKILEAINPDEESVVKNIVQGIDKMRANALCTKPSLAYNIVLEVLGEESYEIIDITLNGDVDQMLSQKQLLENIYKEERENSSISMTVVGFFDGHLNNDILNKKINAIIKILEGKKIEELQDENLISVSAYSENIKCRVKSGNKKINIQIAARYSSFDDKTFLWIGTPLINIEY